MGAPEVLVVGAGPTGLALALQAHDHGARVRLVERRVDPVRRSRALLVHPRTLEVLRPLGVTDALLAHAISAPRVRLHLGGRAVPVDAGGLALPGTPYPPLTLLLQMDVERVLTGALAERGVPVEWGTELAGLTVAEGGAEAVLRSASGVERLDVTVMAGCDGVDSTVRRLAGIGWPGGGYRREVILADVDPADGAADDGVAHVAAGRHGLVFLFPLGEGGARWRLLATRRAGRDDLPPGRSGPPVPLTELQALVDGAGLRVRLGGPAWSTRVRLQHRVAASFRRGPVFLAGDAAHASSPAGGQGMNTGIQDATNLGWKLALAPDSVDPETLLDSYQRERRPVAQQTLALTHLVFWAESATDPLAALLRGTVAPLAAPVVPRLVRLPALTGAGLRLLSGLYIGYRRSPLSIDGRPRRPGRLRAGERVPDDPVGGELSLHDVLAGPGVHLLLDREAPDVDTGPLVHAHRLDRPGRGVVAVRPDGYVGCTGDAGGGGLDRWLALAGASANSRKAANARGP